MVPPFLAYYGVLTQNQSLVQQAYDQCRLYRQYLADDDAGGMWKHIVMGDNTDSGHWSTGKHESSSSLCIAKEQGTMQEMDGQLLACCGSSVPSNTRNIRVICRNRPRTSPTGSRRSTPEYTRIWYATPLRILTALVLMRARTAHKQLIWKLRGRQLVVRRCFQHGDPRQYRLPPRSPRGHPHAPPPGRAMPQGALCALLQLH